MLSLAGATGYDPVARRRVRRLSGRARPWLLPLAVLGAAVVVPLRLTSPDVGLPVAAVVPQAPEGRVLVAVTPSDPAVLALAVPGSRVDVYAAAAATLGGTGGDEPAERVAGSAVVVGPAGAWAAGPQAAAPSPGGPLAPAGVLAGGASGAGALTLAVTDQEAAALASRPGGGLTVAVRPPAPGSRGADAVAGG